LNETIDYASGVHTSRWQASFTIQAEAGKLVFDLPPVQGFTTLRYGPTSLHGPPNVCSRCCRARLPQAKRWRVG
jgi:hypothetical protein